MNKQIPTAFVLVIIFFLTYPVSSAPPARGTTNTPGLGRIVNKPSPRPADPVAAPSHVPGQAKNSDGVDQNDFASPARQEDIAAADRAGWEARGAVVDQAKRAGDQRAALEAGARARTAKEFGDSAAMSLRASSARVDHAWTSKGDRIIAWQKRGIANKRELAQHIEEVRSSPNFSTKLSNQRYLYGKYTNTTSSKGTIVIDDPLDRNIGGTAIPVKDIKKQFDRIIRNDIN